MDPPVADSLVIAWGRAATHNLICLFWAGSPLTTCREHGGIRAAFYSLSSVPFKAETQQLNMYSPELCFLKFWSLFSLFFFFSSSSQITHLPGFSFLPSCSNTGLENCDPSHLDSLKDFAMPREAGNFDVPFSEYPSYLHVEFVSAFGGNFWAFLFRSCMLSYSGNLGFFFSLELILGIWNLVWRYS